jgi:V/A-type H+-transporting ATPase subunit I
MLVAMTKVQIVGRKSDVQLVLGRLHRMGLLELVSALDQPALALAPFPGKEGRAEHLQRQQLLLAQTDGLLALTGDPDAGTPAAEPASSHQLSRELETVTPLVAPLAERAEDLRAELAVLPRYIRPLRRLLPLIPELAELDESEIRALELEAVALVLNTAEESVVDVLRAALRTELGDRFVLEAARVDPEAIGCVIVMPTSAADGVQAVLGRERVRPLLLPPRYESLSFRGALTAMEHRLCEIPGEIETAQTDLHALLAPRLAAWRAARRQLRAEIEQLEAVAQVGATGRAFVIVGWTPRDRVSELRLELERAVGRELALDELTSLDAEAPVLIRNRRLARPFEFLVRLFDLPRTGMLDPTVLMALVLPLMVGVMVGDIVYGTLLLVIALYARRRFAADSATVRDLTRVFVAGSLWAIVFGLLFGEALGDVGHKLGLPALWFYRGGADAVEPLLLFSLAFGAAHVVLGQLLGIWQSVSARRTVEIVNRFGSLLAIGGVLVLAGVASDRLPGATIASLLAGGAVAAGLVLLVAGRGALGFVMGPLELVGTVGNVLSYLRLAAVGLASTYLAMVANELSLLGPIWFGVFIGLFFHSLNLALASFSPMIQALRLHYVEFFSKFYEGGGQPFRPFGVPVAP